MIMQYRCVVEVCDYVVEVCVFDYAVCVCV